MKKAVFTTGLILCGVLASMAQENTTPPPTPPNPNAPEITFQTPVHDFGTLQKGEECVYEFTFTNTGKEPLVIEKAEATCGCTVPTTPKEPIMPGKTGVIKVKYDSNRIGVFTKEVKIYSNAKTNPAVITIKGKIDAPPKEEVFPGNNTSNNSAVQE